MKRLCAMFDTLRHRVCPSAQRADQAIAAAALNRERRENAVAASRSGNAMMGHALAELRDALRRTSH